MLLQGGSLCPGTPDPRPQGGHSPVPLHVLLLVGFAEVWAPDLLCQHPGDVEEDEEVHLPQEATSEALHSPWLGPLAMWDPWPWGGTLREHTHKYGQEDGSLDHPPVRAGVVIPAPMGKERWLWHPLGPSCPPAISSASPLTPLHTSRHGSLQET